MSMLGHFRRQSLWVNSTYEFEAGLHLEIENITNSCCFWERISRCDLILKHQQLQFLKIQLHSPAERILFSTFACHRIWYFSVQTTWSILCYRIGDSRKTWRLKQIVNSVVYHQWDGHAVDRLSDKHERLYLRKSCSPRQVSLVWPTWTRHRVNGLELAHPLAQRRPNSWWSS